MVSAGMAQWDAIVVGAGMAGLTCADYLCSRGLNLLVLEAGEAAGGRIATDRLDGFLLDRGFQVFLTAYPEAQRTLDYAKLQLHRFEPGALIWHAGAFRRLSDPWRRPRHLLATALSPAGSFLDKLRIAKFRRDALAGDLSQLDERRATTTIEMLRQRGFSATVMERFFRPFLGGVFLDRELQTSSRLCEFVFRMFSSGDAALPADGMQAIPQQLADRLPAGVLRLHSPVKAVVQGRVELASGEQLSARQIIVATDAPAAARLTGEKRAGEANRVACVYFAADEPPWEEPILMLNGDGRGPVNNVCVPSQVAPAYAPPRQTLISVTALQWTDVDALTRDVLDQLREWFGSAVDAWRHLRTYPIEYALPRQTPAALARLGSSPRVAAGVYRCGDYCDTASINGAMASGRRAAETVMEDLVR